MLGVKNEALGALNKGDLRKCALAWHIHRHALVTHKWISKRLGTGCERTLTAYINRIKNATDGEALSLRSKLQNV